MASMVFVEPHGAAGDGDVVFCVVIVCLSALSLVFFVASSGAAEGKLRRQRSGAHANGPVFVGGRGCACGGCRAGVGICGTYLS